MSMFYDFFKFSDRLKYILEIFHHIFESASHDGAETSAYYKHIRVLCQIHSKLLFYQGERNHGTNVSICQQVIQISLIASQC